MKIKHVVTSVALSLALGFGAVAGLMANKEAKAVKADAEKWMITICFDNTIPEESGSWGYIDSQAVNFWGTNVTYEGSAESLHQSGVDHFYTVNAVFTSDQIVSGMQINFKENGAKKESQDISISLDSSCNGKVYTFKFPEDVSWVDGKWSYNTLSLAQEPSGQFGNLQTDFVPDPETKSYALRNVSLKADDYISLCPFSFSAHNWHDTASVTRLDAAYFEEYFSPSYGTDWLQVASDGVYDFFLTNEYSDGGILDVRKHENPDESFIYYVLQDNVATNDYIYAWGGNEQFGAWPGTKITEVDGVKEVSGNGVLHFQGSETPKLIYAIPVTIGYPVGDSQFKFNNNNDWESEAREIVGGAAYWYTGAANANAGDAIDFLVRAESIRNSAVDYSVCNISASDAAMLVNMYNDLDEAVRAYVDSSSVYTYKRDGSEGNELVSYRIVVEQLAELANISLVGSDRYFNSAFESNTMVVVIISIAATSALVFTMLLVFKKKKQK